MVQNAVTQLTHVRDNAVTQLTQVRDGLLLAGTVIGQHLDTKEIVVVTQEWSSFFLKEVDDTV